MTIGPVTKTADILIGKALPVNGACSPIVN